MSGYQIFIHTDHATIKYLMKKPVISGRLARWLLLLQEFDITIIDKPGRANVVADFLSRLQSAAPVEHEVIDDRFPYEHLFSIVAHTPWYADIANYLAANRILAHFSPKEKKLIQKSFNFSWIANCLFYTGPDQVMQRCVKEDETYDILHVFHDEPCGGHFVAKRTSMKIFTIGYYWPTLHKDVVAYIRKCDRCQRMGRPTKLDEIPLYLQVIFTPFDKWGMDFVGPIDPPSNGKSYILVCTDYVTKWVEVKAMTHARDNKVVEFLYE